MKPRILFALISLIAGVLWSTSIPAQQPRQTPPSGNPASGPAKADDAKAKEKPKSTNLSSNTIKKSQETNAGTAKNFR